MRDLLELLSLVARLSCYLYGIWQGFHGKWAEGSFFILIASPWRAGDSSDT